MKRLPLKDAYGAVIRRLNRGGVRYVVVGMSGINYYARHPAQAFATLDYDIFIQPTRENVGKAWRALEALGFTLGTKAGALKPFRKLRAEEIRRLVREKRTLVATTPEGLMIELLLEISGYPFSEMERDAATLSVHGIPVRVGRLTKLLQSKRIAGRPKDRQFLKRYQSLLGEEEEA